jgi:hypothetical protein
VKAARAFDFQRAARALNHDTGCVDQGLLEAPLQGNDVGYEITDKFLANFIHSRLCVSRVACHGDRQDS